VLISLLISAKLDILEITGRATPNTLSDKCSRFEYNAVYFNILMYFESRDSEVFFNDASRSRMIFTSSLAFFADLPFLFFVFVLLTDLVETPIIFFSKWSPISYMNLKMLAVSFC
jgi:hypothetical protein